MTDAGASIAQATVDGAGQTAQRNEQRPERPPRDSERGGRAERGNRGGRGRSEPRADNVEPGNLNERGEPRADGRNERRPERNRQPDESVHANAETAAATPIERAAPVASDMASSTEHGNVAGEMAARAQAGAETREKRPRDRHARDRGPRGERAEQGDRQERPARDGQPVSSQEDAATEPRRSYFTASTEAPATEDVIASVTMVAQTPPAAPTPQAPASSTPVPTAAVAPVAAAMGMPKLQSFALPLAELDQVAQSSGLNWVNSDAGKIAAVQAAIAAEPKAVHVPRERPAVVQIDEGPLVLVETKRDLRNMTLPFEEKEPQ